MFRSVLPGMQMITWIYSFFSIFLKEQLDQRSFLWLLVTRYNARGFLMQGWNNIITNDKVLQPGDYVSQKHMENMPPWATLESKRELQEVV